MAAFQNEAGRGDDGIESLLAGESGMFLDPVQRIFRSPPVNRENRFLSGKIDRVVAPFAARDLAAIEIENFAQFVPVKRNNFRHARRAAYAVGYNLYTAGRFTDADGNPIDQRTFIQHAIANNAAADKVNCFGEYREQADGNWPAQDDSAFMGSGQELAAVLPMDCVTALAEALLNERRLAREKVTAIAAQFLKPQ